MELPRTARVAASNDTFEDSMQFHSNYSIIARDEQSFFRKNRLETTQSSLVGVEPGDISWMVPGEISLFKSRIECDSSSRLPPEGAERKARLGMNESMDVSNLSDCSQYKEILELVKKYDLDDMSVSEVPDKILPPAGGVSYKERIHQQRQEGNDIYVPSTEELLAILKGSEGLTPSKLYDRIMESSYNEKPPRELSESDMDMTSCARTPPRACRGKANQTYELPAKVKTPSNADSFLNFNKNSAQTESSFVAMSSSILDKDEKSILEKYGGLPKQADITCPGDQPSLPWNVSNVTLFDADVSGIPPPGSQMENSNINVRRNTSVDNSAGLDALAEQIYALSPSTSFSSISKMILNAARGPGNVPANQKPATGKRP